MNSILVKGIIRDGRVEVKDPINLPDGSEVIIQLPTCQAEDIEEGWDNSPEGIAAWLQWYDSLEPLIFTEEELASLEADRQVRKEWEKAHADERAERLRRMWK